MKINEVTEAVRPGYADDSKYAQVARLGRRLMDMSANMPMKGASDDDIDKSNKMSSFGDALTRFGSSFGPKNMAELIKSARVTPEEAKEFLAIAQKAPDAKLKGDEVEPEEPEADEFGEPDDSEIARQADARAAKRK